MFSRMIKIVEPRRFEEYITCIENNVKDILIKPTFLSICKADMRYYLGLREQNILSLKYPFCLIHEAIGEVVQGNDYLNKGDKVALIPNLPYNCDKDGECKYICEGVKLGENYCPKARFASSNYDGFLREHVLYSQENVIKIPNLRDDKVFVLCELVSVACAAARRTNLDEFEEIVIWGSGNMAYIMGAVLKYYYRKDVVVIGRNEERLKMFNFCDTVLTSQKIDIGHRQSLFFECVGGNNSQSAINQIIKTAPIGSEIILMGVPNINPQLDIRSILEKGLVLKGTTRSEKKDFAGAVKCFENHKFFEVMEKLILRVIEVRDIYDVQKCFELEAIEKNLGKNIMKLNL